MQVCFAANIVDEIIEENDLHELTKDNRSKIYDCIDEMFGE